VSIVFITAAAGLALVLPDVLRLVSRNKAYHAGAAIVPVMVLAYLFQGFFLLASVGITVAKEARYYPMITAASAALNIGLNLWLIPHHGILASAWATVAGYALMAFMGAAISTKLYPIPIQWPRIAGAFLASVLFFLLGTVFDQGLAGAFARAGLALAFAAFVWRATLDETDRGELRKVVGLQSGTAPPHQIR
jgi:O-antigen/teichoic acid export membrane protein